MIKKIVLLGILLQVCLFSGAQILVAPSVKSKTSFAIVVDKVSYEKVKEAIGLYRQVVEKDGLGTYILVDDWKSPEAVREQLIKLHADKKSPIEGTVLVGDIPIPMIRDAQHLSSAFKMNQTRDWKLSSIPSDRFYDDFGLTFKFLKQDKEKPLYFYYSLEASSGQTISSDIYSARMKPLELEGQDKYALLDKYLRKVVAERLGNPENVLDNLSMGRGHGYNSESKDAWSGEQLALREQFPELFKTGNRVKFMDFDSRWPIKDYYLNEVQRPELDVMLFHHHGAEDTQYLNGYKEVSEPASSIENVKLYLRGKVKSAYDKNKDKEAAIQQYVSYLGVPREWCEEAFDPKKIEADSLFNLELDIIAPDIRKITPNARFVMFDACFNGSFYEKDNIAGSYIFNGGKTLITQGNTVNTIQDKWPDEFLGFLDAGVRIGLWGKQVHFLETHLIGDPTYHFANRSALKFDINEALTLHNKDVSFWKKLLTYPSPDVQAMALRKLYENNYPGISGLLKDTYFASSYGIVRLEALRLLGKADDQNFVDVLKSSVDDSYELVRRFSVEYIGKNGSDELVPAFARAFISDLTSARVYFKVAESFGAMNLDKLEKEVKKQAEATPLYDRTEIDKFLNSVPRLKATEKEELASILDTTTTVKEKRFVISAYRNHPDAVAVDALLSFASDASRDKVLRVNAVEALGWYNFSYRKAEIVQGLQKIASADKDKEIAYEALKSVNRLK